MNEKNTSRRRFLKTTAYSAPIILSFNATASFANSGSLMNPPETDQDPIDLDMPPSNGGNVGNASDRRLKKDIKYLTTLENDIKLYSFKYNWGDEQTYVGVMAQDILNSPVFANAVITRQDGFYAVDYSHLGLRMVTIEEWKQSEYSIYSNTSKVA